MNDDYALSYDPFGGDDTDAHTLRNAIIRTRTAHDCAGCLDPIPPRTTDVRAMTQAFEGEVMTWWWCPACVAAMRAEREWVEDHHDPDDLPPFERRQAVGQRRARERERAP